MIEESKYCNDIMKKHFNKELAMTKKDDEDYENSTERWICDNVYVDGDVKVRDDCHITEKCRGSVHRDCNIKVILNHKMYAVFPNLKIYDLHLIMQELGSSNINEVIRAVLNFLSFFYEKISHAQKGTKNTKNYQKPPKTTKSAKSTKKTKTKPRKSTKHK